jgi:hypothetical protein
MQKEKAYFSTISNTRLVYTVAQPTLTVYLPERALANGTTVIICPGAAATDDRLAPHSVRLYNMWTAAGKPAELHIYSKDGHGFGMRRQNLPVDHWIEGLGEWLALQRLLKKTR